MKCLLFEKAWCRKMSQLQEWNDFFFLILPMFNLTVLIDTFSIWLLWWFRVINTRLSFYWTEIRHSVFHLLVSLFTLSFFPPRSSYFQKKKFPYFGYYYYYPLLSYETVLISALEFFLSFWLLPTSHLRECWASSCMVLVVGWS